MSNIIEQIYNCTLCRDQLSHEINPILNYSPKSKIIIIGQAPGAKVHKTGIPWNDQSGDNLRSWLGVNKETFYDKELISLIPMGFCYPGKGKSGDLPPRKECAPKWHPYLFEKINKPSTILLVGIYAQKYYLQKKAQRTLTETVKNFKEYLPQYFVLPHPSPRNNIWQAKNPWFKEAVLPELKSIIHSKI